MVHRITVFSMSCLVAINSSFASVGKMKCSRMCNELCSSHISGAGHTFDQGVWERHLWCSLSLICSLRQICLPIASLANYHQSFGVQSSQSCWINQQSAGLGKDLGPEAQNTLLYLGNYGALAARYIGAGEVNAAGVEGIAHLHSWLTVWWKDFVLFLTYSWFWLDGWNIHQYQLDTPKIRDQ